MSLLENDVSRISSYTYQKSYNFEVLLPPVGIVDPLKVSRLVEEISYKDYSMAEVDKIRFGSFQSYYAGFFDKGPITIKFRETEYGDVKRYLRAWRNLMIDRRGLYKRKKGLGLGYAKPIVLNYLDNKMNITNVVTFSYAFPIKFNDWDLSYNQSGLQSITVEFACDKVDDIKQDLISFAEQPLLDLLSTGLKRLGSTLGIGS